MKLDREMLEKNIDTIFKVKLVNGNLLRGRLRELVDGKDGKFSIVIQSNTYTFQIEQTDIESVEPIAAKIW